MINVEELKAEISQNGCTIEDIAGEVGIDRATFYRRIKNDSLRISDIQKICNRLNIGGERAIQIFLGN